MSSLKKNLFWVCAGIVLLAEIGFGVVSVRGQASANAGAHRKMETERKRLKKLVGKESDLANKKIIQSWQSYRRDVARNGLDALLFLLERDYQMERIVPTPEGSIYQWDPNKCATRKARLSRLFDALAADAEKAGIRFGAGNLYQPRWQDRVPSPEHLLSGFKSWSHSCSYS